MDTARLETWHRKHHPRRNQPIADCWHCQRDRAKCRSKIPFATREEVDAWIDELHRCRNYATPVVRYRCRWCPHYHYATAVTRVQKRRVEKARRRSLYRS